MSGWKSDNFVYVFKDGLITILVLGCSFILVVYVFLCKFLLLVLFWSFFVFCFFLLFLIWCLLLLLFRVNNMFEMEVGEIFLLREIVVEFFRYFGDLDIFIGYGFDLSFGFSRWFYLVWEMLEVF